MILGLGYFHSLLSFSALFANSAFTLKSFCCASRTPGDPYGTLDFQEIRGQKHFIVTLISGVLFPLPILKFVADNLILALSCLLCIFYLLRRKSESVFPMVFFLVFSQFDILAAFAFPLLFSQSG